MRRISRDLVATALTAARESKYVEFKRECDLAAPGALVELIKDIVAMANSGGGVVLIGVEDDGEPSGHSPSSVLTLDPADLTNAIAKYTGEQFDGFEISEAKKKRRRLAVIRVSAKTGAPLVFEKPGTYSTGDRNQKTAFGRGTTYFRHGAKSEPATARDVTRFIEAEVERLRRTWLKNVRKVSIASEDAQVIVVSPQAGPSGTVDRFRIVDDPDALAVARTDFDMTHPYRQTELIRAVNARAGAELADQWGMQCVRRVYGIDERPEYFHVPKYGSPQYSDALLSWITTELQRDRKFFEKAKATHKSRASA